MGRWVWRVGAVCGGFVAAIVIAGTAYAHVDVSAAPAVAGSSNAVLTFDAEAESNSAGVASVRIVLPAGIAPSEVSLKSGPAGWTLTPGSDGYTVGGPALPVGEDVLHSVTVARLPDATKLVFKALVNYTDATVDRWIEEPAPANPNPANPALVLTLAPNPNPAPATTTPAPTTPPVTTPAVRPSPTPAAAPGDSDGGRTGWVWWLIAAVVVIAAVATWVLLRRRGPGATGS